MAETTIQPVMPTRYRPKLAMVTHTPAMMLVSGVVLRISQEISTWKQMMPKALRLIRCSGLTCPLSSTARDHSEVSKPRPWATPAIQAAAGPKAAIRSEVST